MLRRVLLRFHDDTLLYIYCFTIFCVCRLQDALSCTEAAISAALLGVCGSQPIVIQTSLLQKARVSVPLGIPYVEWLPMAERVGVCQRGSPARPSASVRER